MFYDIDSIFNEANEESLSLGKRIYYASSSGRYLSSQLGGKTVFSFDNSLFSSACDQADADKISVSITFDEQGGLYEYSCSCDQFDPSLGACPHVVAAALKLSETVNIGLVPTSLSPAAEKNTDFVVTSIIKDYTRRRNIRFMPSEEKIELEPILCLFDDDTAPVLRLKLGRTRRYSIKNIGEFLSAVASGATIRYGALLKFRHDIESFTKESGRLIDFLLKGRKDRQELLSKSKSDSLQQKRSTQGTGEKREILAVERDEFFLSYGERDEFFSMFLDKSIALWQNNIAMGFRQIVKDDSFRPTLIIKNVEGGYSISLAREGSCDNPKILLEGRNSCYYITDSHIFVCSLQLWDRAAPLVNALKNGDLFVSKKDMPVFYNNVLSRVFDVLNIDAGAIDLSIFSSPPLSAAIYLDSCYRPATPSTEGEGDTQSSETSDYGGIEAELRCRYGDAEVDIFSENNALMYRDWETENRLKASLAAAFPYYPRLYLTEDEDIYNLYKEGLSGLYNYADIYLSDSLAPIRIKKSPRVSLGIRLNAGLLELDFSGSNFSQNELTELANAYKNRRKYIRLGDGSFIDLADEMTGALSELLALGEARDKKIVMPAYYSMTAYEQAKSGYLEIDAEESYRKFLSDFQNYSKQDMDFGALTATLRGYQKEGAKWLKMLKNCGLGGILADDMGLGKTIQMLTLISDHKNECANKLEDKSECTNKSDNKNECANKLEDKGECANKSDNKDERANKLEDKGECANRTGTSIVICPTSLIINWAKEAAQFAKGLKVLPIMGGARERAELILGNPQAGIPPLSDFDLVITSYELLKRDIELYEGFNFEIAVLDEAQYIKNHDTQNARSVKRLKANHRFALTGTPIENSLSEMWSIFDFLMPGYLFSYSKFRNTFEAGIVKGNVESVAALKKLVSPFILRRLKSAVLDELPPKVETEITIPLCEGQEEIYKKHLALIRSAIERGEAKDKITVLSMLTRLRQICCDPSLIDEHYSGNSEKLDTCINLLKNSALNGRKVLMFSQFTSMLRIIKQKLSAENIKYYTLEGSTKKQERNRLIERFNVDETPVFLISLRAGGTGINLTGADTVIHYDPWWNDPVMNQATDRAHRIGQKKSVQVYKLIIKDSIEERIVSLRQKKSALAGLFVQGEESLSISELMNLLL